jgi:hypothetical protein
MENPAVPSPTVEPTVTQDHYGRYHFGPSQSQAKRTRFEQ